MGSILANLNHVMRSRDPTVEDRRAVRDLVDLISHVKARGRTYGVRVINVSPLGLMCRTDADVTLGEKITVWLPLVHDIGAEVRWVENGRVGLEFLSPVPHVAYDKMLALMPARRTAW